MADSASIDGLKKSEQSDTKNRSDSDDSSDSDYSSDEDSPAPTTNKRKHDDLEQEPKCESEKPQLTYDELTAELTQAKQKIKLCESQESKQAELTTCYICLLKMKWPLQICEAGHFACADCLRKQIISSGGSKWKQQKSENTIPIYNHVWEPNFKCGLCKADAKPKYAGPVVTQLIDNIPNLMCPICKETFSEAMIGMHIVTCDHHIVGCPICKVGIKAGMINNHINGECSQLVCGKCNFKGTAMRLLTHVVKHAVVNRAVLAIPKMAQIPKDVAMERFDLLVQAIQALDELTGNKNKELYEDMLKFLE